MYVILRVRDINGTPIATGLAELPDAIARALRDDFDLAQPGDKLELEMAPPLQLRGLAHLKRLTIEASE